MSSLLKKSRNSKDNHDQDGASSMGCAGCMSRKMQAFKKKASAQKTNANEGAGVEDQITRKSNGTTGNAPIKRKKNKDVVGKVVFEKSPRTELWHTFISNSLLATSIAEQAAACSNQDGGIIAFGPEKFTPSVEQIMRLVEFIKASKADVNMAPPSKFEVSTMSFEFVEMTRDGCFLAGSEAVANSDETKAEPSRALVAMLTNTALIVAVTPSENGRGSRLHEMLKESIGGMIAQGL